jgi:hypothetical protein
MNPGAWPRIMGMELAAGYVGEKSIASFRRRIGSAYPRPLVVPGRGRVWLKEMLDECAEQLRGTPKIVRDIADVLYGQRRGPRT